MDQRGQKSMGKPKKRTSARKTGLRRSHIVLKLARAVNAKSPIKVRTTTKQSGKKLRKTAATE
jgi:ribosomal protein L32